ncbi:MAG: hypothetical protein OXC29_23130 [Rhodococcus sp.]|nr:hypothetical protein [Rhodococcus sp. (in: high G+C Gram-positive bacteria)]
MSMTARPVMSVAADALDAEADRAGMIADGWQSDGITYGTHIRMERFCVQQRGPLGRFRRKRWWILASPMTDDD